jgi:hypothetical protein
LDAKPVNIFVIGPATILFSNRYAIVAGATQNNHKSSVDIFLDLQL